ncbi:hypothetical protein ACLMJK_002133 [Lecanora helva]
MSRSTDPNHFFQSSHSLAEANRKEYKSKINNGSPIRLQSKILAAIADPTNDNTTYIAESVGTARRIVLDDQRQTTHIYRGPSAPITSLAISVSSSDETLFAGSWDKSIWSWSTSTPTPKRRYSGHTDFVTALLSLTINTVPILISGSSDASIIVWDITSGSKLHTLKSHTRGILDLAIDPTTYPPSEDTTVITFFSASSDRTIRRWNLSTDLQSSSELDAENPIIQHRTNVYALRFDADSDLWTASADGTSKCLSHIHNFEVDTTLRHGDCVRAVAVDDCGDWIVTAGRDEHVKVWERASGKLHHTYEGHFEEVTGLVVVGGQKVVSVSIDKTVRQWSMERNDLARAREAAEKARNGIDDDENDANKVKDVRAGGMTEEEEKELEELMEVDDD